MGSIVAESNVFRWVYVQNFKRVAVSSDWPLLNNATIVTHYYSNHTRCVFWRLCGALRRRQRIMCAAVGHNRKAWTTNILMLLPSQIVHACPSRVRVPSLDVFLAYSCFLFCSSLLRSPCLLFLSILFLNSWRASKKNRENPFLLW